MTPNKTNRFPHLFHKLPVDIFWFITLHLPVELVVKISKRVYFDHICANCSSLDIDFAVLRVHSLLPVHFRLTDHESNDVTYFF